MNDQLNPAALQQIEQLDTILACERHVPGPPIVTHYTPWGGAVAYVPQIECGAQAAILVRHDECGAIIMLCAEHWQTILHNLTERDDTRWVCPPCGSQGFTPTIREL